MGVPFSLGKLIAFTSCPKGSVSRESLTLSVKDKWKTVRLNQSNPLPQPFILIVF